MMGNMLAIVKFIDSHSGQQRMPDGGAVGTAHHVLHEQRLEDE